MIAFNGRFRRSSRGAVKNRPGHIEVDDYLNTPKSNSDCWYFALEKSLRREAIEEVGVEIGRVKYLLDLAFIRPDGIPVITLSFYCDWQSGEVKLNEENVDFRWVEAN